MKGEPYKTVAVDVDTITEVGEATTDAQRAAVAASSCTRITLQLCTTDVVVMEDGQEQPVGATARSEGTPQVGEVSAFDVMTGSRIRCGPATTGDQGTRSRSARLRVTLQPIGTGTGDEEKRDVVIADLEDDYACLLQFNTPGEYDVHLGSFRALVVVKDKLKESESTGITYAAVLVAIEVILVTVVAVTVQQIFSSALESSANGEINGQSYVGVRAVVEVGTEYALPWLTASLALFVMMIVSAVSHCCKPHSRSQRTYSTAWQLAGQTTTILLAALCTGLVFGVWQQLLHVNGGLGEVFRVVSLGVTNAVNEALGALVAMRYLAQELPAIVPSINVPTSALATISTIQNVAVSVQQVAAHGDSIVRAIVEAEAILAYLALQSVFLASALALTSAKTRSSRPMYAASFLATLALSVVLFTVGLVQLKRGIFQVTYEVSAAFNNNTLTSEGVQRNLGVGPDSPVLAIYQHCAPNGTLSPIYLRTVINTLVGQLNGATAGTPLPQLSPIASASIADMVLDATYLSQQLDTLTALAEQDPVAFTSIIPLVSDRVGPFVRAAAATIRVMQDLVGCKVIRDVIADALPTMKNDLLARLDVELVLMYVMVAALVLLIVATVIASVVFHYPTAEARIGYWDNQALPALASVPSALAGTYAFHNVNIMTLSGQAALMVIANASGAFDQTSVILIVVSYLCLAVAVATMLDMLCATRPAVRVVARVLTWMICAAAAVLSMVHFERDVSKVAECVDLLQHGGNSTNGTLATVLKGECSAESVVLSVQTATLCFVVIITCLIALVTCAILIFMPSYNPFTHRVRELDAEADAERSRNADADRRTNAEILGAGALLLIAVVGAVVFAVVANENRHGGAASSGGAATSTLNPYQFLLPPSPASSTTSCNGFEGLCDTPVHRIIWPSTHNSHSSLEDAFVTPNHYYGLRHSLNAGYRAFMVDTWAYAVDPSRPYLCHQLCALGRQPMARLLNETLDFLHRNPREVVLFMLEQYYHTPNMTILFDEMNATAMAWSPANATDSPQLNPHFQWPTLRQLIDAGKRLLIFTDTRAGTVINPAPPPPWLLFVWDYMYENPYTGESIEDLGCKLNRGADPSRAVMLNKMPVLNHYLSAPLASPGLASAANAKAVLSSHTRACAAAWGAVPAVVSVDFWDVQEPMRTLVELQQSIVLHRHT